MTFINCIICVCLCTHTHVFSGTYVFSSTGTQRSLTLLQGSAELLGMQGNLACGELSGRFLSFGFLLQETALSPLLCTGWFLYNSETRGLICSHLCCLQLSTTSAHGSSLARDTLLASGEWGFLSHCHNNFLLSNESEQNLVYQFCGMF